MTDTIINSVTTTGTDVITKAILTNTTTKEVTTRIACRHTDRGAVNAINHPANSTTLTADTKNPNTKEEVASQENTAIARHLEAITPSNRTTTRAASKEIRSSPAMNNHAMNNVQTQSTTSPEAAKNTLTSNATTTEPLTVRSTKNKV